MAPESFFPATMEGWVRLLLVLGGFGLSMAGFAWRFMRLPLLTQINGLGDRVKLVELSAAARDPEIRKLDRAGESARHDLMALHDRVGRIEGATERLISAMERNRDAHMEEEGEIRERLVRIETKVDGILKVRDP